MQIHTPEWVKHAVFYQIYPDRFARSSRLQHPPGIQFKPWGSPPEEQGFQGGDLLGVVDKLDYLQDLGINAIYLNPIFSSASNHRYHTFDYMQVDPLLGGNAALRELLDAAHRRKMRVVLDGVFNHASRGFWAFHHILETGGNSPYLDWFHIYNWPLRPYSSDADNPPNYAAWWDLPALPKFNIQNPGVRKYLLDVAKFWVEFGIDGWRLDVPEEIDDAFFWQDFRRVVKHANPDAYIVGEIWHLAQSWLRGDRFDAVMNYPVGIAAINFFGAKHLRKFAKNEDFSLHSLTAEKFAERIDNIYGAYDWEINTAQMNMFDSHDTPRALWLVNEDLDSLRLATLFLMCMPGAPCIYYGTEIGMSGADDPHCRGAFPWDEPEKWDNYLREFYQGAIRLRKEHVALRTGSYHSLFAQKNVVAFGRKQGDYQQIFAVFNAGSRTKKVTIPASEIAENGKAFHSVWGEPTDCRVSDGEIKDLHIPGRSAIILVNSR
ncbi:MAG: alpha-amylase [Calditrichaeota bacterium]|nr:alpha-amylase [Calditrichota bacterium]MCB0269783.1 alpha-amylase [Calditrichota bacterium]MCB9068129.1 alpha-amylase [Calditrichia bacterium]